MNVINTIFKKELIDTIRDKRTIMMMVIVPILITPLLMFGLLKFMQYQDQKSEDKVVRIAFYNDSDDLVIENLFLKNNNIKLIKDIPIDSLESMIKADSIDGGIQIPLNFINLISKNIPSEINIYFKSSDLMTKSKKRIQETLEAYKKIVLKDRLAILKIDQSVLEPLVVNEIDISSKKETIGKLVGGFLPYIFVAFIFLGAMYPAIDLGSGEKERGSLETLLSSPATRFEITMGKLVVVSIAGVSSGILSLIGICIPAAFMPGVPAEIQALVFELLNPNAIFMIILLMVPIAVFFSSLILSVSFYARSFKEAQSLIGPLNMIVFVPIMLSLGPGIELNHVTALVPIVNVGLITKEILSGSLEMVYFMETFLSLMGYALVGVRFTVYWFNKENTIFRI